MTIWLRLLPYLLAAVITGYIAFALVDASHERQYLKDKVATQEEVIKVVKRTASTTSSVLSTRAQSKAAIQERAKDVQEAITIRIPADAGTCVLPPDWRLLHDAAAADSGVPPATSGTDAPAVTPQEAARTVSENYERYHDTADQLRALQQWIRELSKP